MAKNKRYQPHISARLSEPLTLANTNPADPTPMPGVMVNCNTGSSVEFAFMVASLIETFCQQNGNISLESMLVMVNGIAKEAQKTGKTYFDMAKNKKR